MNLEEYEALIRLLDLSTLPEHALDDLLKLRSFFSLDASGHSKLLFDARVQILFTLLPKQCIYPKDEIGRKQIAREYLEKKYNLDTSSASHLGNRLISLIDRLDISRKDVSRSRQLLMEQQHGRCAHCNQLLFAPVESLPEDFFKPYKWYPMYIEPEVDHIDPVSLFGHNDINNLQLLCRYCNTGKGNGLSIEARLIHKYSALPRSIPPPMELCFYLSAVVYRAISRDRVCSICSGNQNLTIDLVNKGISIILQNVKTICGACRFGVA